MGAEEGSQGRYDILPITDEMVWLPASDGQVCDFSEPRGPRAELMSEQIPKGRRPVEGVRPPLPSRGTS